MRALASGHRSSGINELLIIEEDTKQQVLDWLKTLPPETTFKTNNELECPMAGFIKSKLDPNGFFKYVQHSPLAAVKSKFWCVRFAGMVDLEPTETITVQRAIEILETVE